MPFKDTVVSNDEPTNINQLWTKLSGQRSNLIERSERYAGWTVPHIFPTGDSQDAEQQQALNATGAEAVNHLSNVVATTMFAPQSPFFRVKASREATAELVAAGIAEEDITASLAGAEQDAISYLNKKRLREKAVNTAKLLIVTGNALFFTNLEDRKIIVYSVRDYVIKRNSDGDVKMCITRDNKTWGTLTAELQARILATADSQGKKREFKDEDVVEVFTKIVWDYTTERVNVQQAVADFDLPQAGDYPMAESPWIPLAWHLNRGDDYGRGLVEDFAGAFHALDILTESLIKGLAIMADIKFFVRPGSTIDIEALNKADTGTYHSGHKDDITAQELNKVADFAAISSGISEYIRQIARAFLQNGVVTRDAERVTALEIQIQANELDTALGGIYSSLAEQWQRPLAHIALSEGPGLELGEEFEPVIITGVETLTRANDTAQFRFLLDDVAAMNSVPEEMRIAIDPTALWTFLATNRNVDISQFLLSKEEVAAKQQAERQQALQDMASEKGFDAAGDAFKADVQQP